jgi:BarA-like signal transduction histidine kinase
MLSFFCPKEAIGMIKKVSIQLNQSLICGGVAIVERDGTEACIFFDVVKSSPLKVIVGSRGKQVPEHEADAYEAALLHLFEKHNVPLKLGTYSISA